MTKTDNSKRVGRWAADPRLLDKKRVGKNWLLGSTALVAGVMAAGMVGATPAFAEQLGVACNINPANYYTCAGPEANPLLLEPTDTFDVDLGPNPDLNPLDLDVSSGDPALTIDAGRNDTGSGGIQMYPQSAINNDTGVGLEIIDPGAGGVVLDVNDDWGQDGWNPAAIVGTTGILITTESEDSGGPGRMTIYNNGHVQGTTGAGIEATGGTSEDGGTLIFELQNHSYESTIGAIDGVYVHDDIVWTEISNGNGLIAGLSRDGIHVVNVDNNDQNHNAVQLNNNSAGVLAGYANGIYVSDVDVVGDGNGDVQINNDMYYDDGGDNPENAGWRRGGLIVGTNEDGVAVYDVAGDVRINNSGTLGDSVDFAGMNLDPEVFNGIDGLLDDNFLFGGIQPTMGIWGQHRGVNIYDVGGQVEINNDSYYNEEGGGEIGGGLIVGVMDDAVHISGVEGRQEFNGDDSWFSAVNLRNGDGLIWGGDDGVYIRNADGNVDVHNYGGAIFGLEDGLQVDDTWRGGVWVGNAGGHIQGFYGNGITIADVTEWDDSEDSFGSFGGWVGINNGDFDGNPNELDENYNPEWGSDGGLIWGADSAIRVTEARHVFIGNGVGGLIVGDGDWQEPVIDLETSNQDGGGVDIVNLGLMTSDNIPYFSRSWVAPGVTVVPDSPLDETAIAQLETDHADINNFAWNGGQVGNVDNLSLYGEAASDMLLWSRGGAVYAENHGVMIGRVNIDGHNGNDWPDVRGNGIKNFGTWLVTDNGEWNAVEMHGSSNDWINNAGLIQTAFGAETYETAYFGGVNDFTNGGYYDDGFHAENGLLSMIDGGVRDYTWIDHNFHGGDEGSLTSFVGIDVDFSPSMADEWERSDFLEVEGNINGSTGLIINKVGGATGRVNDWIQVAHVNGYDDNNGDQYCFFAGCQAGDTMYISDRSMNYQEVDGIGTIRDGFYSWYLTETPTEEVPDPDFYLVSDFSPNAVQLASLITGAQNIWYETAGVVADHVYGNHFPLNGEGGGGVDLIVGEEPTAPATAPNFSVWGKASGSWTNQDDTVTQTIGPVTLDIDTSFVQTTFSLLAGVDYASNPGGDGFRAGVFGGLVGSDLEFDSYDASATYSGGTVGAYGALTFGGFYADAEAKADFLNMDYSAIGIDASANVTSMGLLANAGYRMEMGGFFLTPNGSVAVVHSDIDDISAGGASVAFSNGDSVRAGAGIEVGTTLQTGEMTTQLAVSGKLWNEFQDANEVTITDGGGDSATFSDDISGAFAELRATATAYSDDRSFSAFATAGTKFNEDFTTVDGKIGIRKGF